MFRYLLLSVLFLANLTAQANSFSSDLKTGKVFSFEQKDKFFSNLLNKDVTYQLDYTRWIPEKSNGHVIVYNHGLQSHRAWFNSTAEYLRSMGYVVYAFDRIGSGTSSDAYALDGYPLGIEEFLPFLPGVKPVTRRGHIQDYHMFLDSIDLMLDIVEKEQSIKTVHIWANSYGAKIITRYLLDEDRSSRVQSAIFTTPGLFRNQETMPLPFSKLELIGSKNSDYFPSPVTAMSNDNGASWFTDDNVWLSKISNDKLSIRHMTRRLALQTRAMDKYIEDQSEHSNPLHNKKRFYLLVNDDAMMDNDKVIAHIEKNKMGSKVKYYEGGSIHKHFLTFTNDAQAALSDIHEFISKQPEISKSTVRATQ
ncbi:MAG: alpha-beta hydrolase superfamily lysophospholipase [Bermanella sp.]|jgi:alpha-beta hydrolase superfamily lysophospholipase